MDWLYTLLIEHSALQAVIILSLISAAGLGLGKIHFFGISLGVTFVFFIGILAGHFGLSIDPQMLQLAETFWTGNIRLRPRITGRSRIFQFIP